jgi:predicted nucleic acid-binding Zn ribbon protein
MSTIIEEQKAACMEESLENLKNDDNKRKFKRKEIRKMVAFIIYLLLIVIA